MVGEPKVVGSNPTGDVKGFFLEKTKKEREDNNMKLLLSVLFAGCFTLTSCCNIQASKVSIEQASKKPHHKQSFAPTDQFSVVKGYPGNSYARIDIENAISIETYCLVWGDIPGYEKECWQLVVRRGMVEFPLPFVEGEPIKSLILSYEIGATDNDDPLLIAPVYSQPSAADWNLAWGVLYDGLGYDGHSGDQTRYYGFLRKDVNFVVLNENAITDFEAAAAMGQGWFAMGFRHQNDLSSESIRSTEIRHLKLTVVLDEDYFNKDKKDKNK